MALIDDIKSRVMRVLNEMMPGDNQYNDILSFDMDNSIDEAGRRVALAAPLHMLKVTRTEISTLDSVTIDGHIVRVNLPVYYLRLVSAKIDGWLQPVYGNELLTPEHALYARQANKMTAGGAHKPVVALANNKFELFSLPDGYENAHQVYITYFPNHNISNWEDVSAGNSYPKELIEPVVWQTASLLFNIMEEYDNATLAQNRCNELLSLTRAL